MDNFQAIVIGAAAAAIGTVVAYKYINLHPIGGPSPAQPDMFSYNARGSGLRVTDLTPTDPLSAPVAQTNPNTEAAFNQYETSYGPAFGSDENRAAQEEVLPI